MVMRWYRENVWAAAVVTLLRIYLGVQWIEAGWHKLSGGFDASGFLKGALGKPVMDKATQELVYPNFNYFLEHFALPNVKLINFLIPVGEFLIGVGLIVGGLTLAAGFFGILLNMMFMLAGTVSTNPWLMIIAVIVMTAGANAGRFGLDYYLLPLLRKTVAKVTGKRIDNGGVNGKILPH